MPDPLLLWALAYHQALQTVALVAVLTALRTRRADRTEAR